MSSSTAHPTSQPQGVSPGINHNAMPQPPPPRPSPSQLVLPEVSKYVQLIRSPWLLVHACKVHACKVHACMQLMMHACMHMCRDDTGNSPGDNVAQGEKIGFNLKRKRVDTASLLTVVDPGLLQVKKPTPVKYSKPEWSMVGLSTLLWWRA